MREVSSPNSCEIWALQAPSPNKIWDQIPQTFFDLVLFRAILRDIHTDFHRSPVLISIAELHSSEFPQYKFQFHIIPENLLIVCCKSTYNLRMRRYLKF